MISFRFINFFNTSHLIIAKTKFIHLSEVIVTPGQRVEAGDLIARVGATGRATGPHLDWRINWFEVRIDPDLVLKNFPVIKVLDDD